MQNVLWIFKYAHQITIKISSILVRPVQYNFYRIVFFVYYQT